MSTPNPVVTTPVVVPQAPATPWYTSKVQIAQVVTLLSALTAISPRIAKTFGWTDTQSITDWVTALFGTIAFVAPIAGIAWRALSSLQPLTLTRAAAAAHPATQAAIAAVTTTTQVTGVTHVQPSVAPAVAQSAHVLSVPFAGSNPGVAGGSAVSGSLRLRDDGNKPV